MMTLQIDDLQFGYTGSGRFRPVPSPTPEHGCLLLGRRAVANPLFWSMAGALSAEHGRIALAGQDISQLGARMDRFRGTHIGFIYQTLNLIPWLSVRENIALGLAFAPNAAPARRRVLLIRLPIS